MWNKEIFKGTLPVSTFDIPNAILHDELDDIYNFVFYCPSLQTFNREIRIYEL